ncbi:MAG TPA: nucleotidyltransferase domain-containing protein [Ktedonobacteraceae bacterium]
MKQLEIIEPIIDILKDVQGVQAIVLGGSWAYGAQRPDSDIDLGLYYQQAVPLDLGHIHKIASKLNDFADPTVSDLGEWGKWVNGGAWLTIKGQRVDFLYRNIDFVAGILDDCNRGETQFDYYQQPAYGFHSYIYCAEIQLCKILYDPDGVIQSLKTKVVQYPQALKSRIINSFVWNAQFTLENAKKPAMRGDVYFTAGCITRIASDLVQAIYALNETYFISDKRLGKDIERFSMKPENFRERIDNLLGHIGSDSEKLFETFLAADSLLREVIALCRDQYKAKY